MFEDTFSRDAAQLLKECRVSELAILRSDSSKINQESESFLKTAGSLKTLSYDYCSNRVVLTTHAYPSLF